MSPLNIDALVSRAMENRIWVYVSLFILCIVNKFKWTFVMGYCFMFATDVFAVVNRAYTLPPSVEPLGEKDVAVVTGGSCGLGLEIVKKLVFEHGVRCVFVLDVAKPKFRFAESVVFVPCDLASPSAVDTALDSIIAQCTERKRPISILINNAGVRRSGSLLNMDRERFRYAFDVNAMAPAMILKRVASNHIKTFPTRRLSIVTVSSVLGILGPRNLSAYSASKAALTQIHECLVQELQGYPAIRMLLVVPGQLTSDMFRDVKPRRLFFAPIVNHCTLARAIVHKVSNGETGVMCEPLYARFLPLMKVMPSLVVQVCRSFSGIDNSIGEAPEE